MVLPEVALLAGMVGELLIIQLSAIANDQQALLAIAILASLKVVNAMTHYLLSRV